MLANSTVSQAICAWEKIIRTCSFLEHLLHILVSLVKNQLFQEVLHLYVHLTSVLTCVWSSYEPPLHLCEGHPQLGQGVQVEEAAGLHQEELENERIY